MQRRGGRISNSLLQLSLSCHGALPPLHRRYRWCGLAVGGWCFLPYGKWSVKEWVTCLAFRRRAAVRSSELKPFSFRPRIVPSLGNLSRQTAHLGYKAMRPSYQLVDTSFLSFVFCPSTVTQPQASPIAKTSAYGPWNSGGKEMAMPRSRKATSQWRTPVALRDRHRWLGRV